MESQERILHSDHFCSHWLIKLSMKFFAPISDHALYRQRREEEIDKFDAFWIGELCTLYNYEGLIPASYFLGVCEGLRALFVMPSISQ